LIVNIFRVIAGATLGVVSLVLALTAPSMGQTAPAEGIAGPVIYSSDIHDSTDARLGEGPAAINIVGARGGSFSGKVVVSSSEPLKGLKAKMSELRQGDASIPADRIAVRYAVPWEGFVGRTVASGSDIMLEAPRPQYAPGRGGKAVAPVWITVNVPRDAKPGNYTGMLNIEIAGGQLADVPVALSVSSWTIPATQDWRTWMDFVQSPDTLAVEYELPMWSEKHWAMIAKSLRHVGEGGGRVVYIPLMARSNMGNAETMVRWIRKTDGSYSHDFSIMDKYLDLASKHMGEPKIVCFYVWDAFMDPPPEKFWVVEEGDSKYTKEEKGRMAARVALKGKGPPVTVVDPATGKTENVYLPPWSDPASKTLWQPVWKEIRERLAKRGLEKTMMMGMWTDWRPIVADAEALRELSGDLPWVSCAHHAAWVDEKGKQMATQAMPKFEKLGSVGYTCLALGFRLVINPEKERFYGWRNPMLHAQYWRGGYFNTHHLASIRHDPETQITGLQRGLGHMGADFWHAVRDAKGQRRQTVTDRYTEAYWHNLNIYHSFLAPGPDGPVTTSRYEVMREGTQMCEARIAIEAALLDPAVKAKLGDELAQRAQAFLDEQHRNIYRSRGAPEADFKHGFVLYRTYDYDLKGKWDAAAGHAWFLRSDWSKRVGQLFDLAAEVQRK
jgi:hypothetical protein